MKHEHQIINQKPHKPIVNSTCT